MRCRRDLTEQADVILKRAHCDAVTGAKIDKEYRQNERAKAKRLGRHRRAQRKKLGKLGPASTVRTITTGEM